MAIKGSARQMVVLRCVDSEMFETAFFVIKPGRKSHGRGGDILREANRIVEANSIPERTARVSRLKRFKMKLFALGVLAGSVTGGAVWLAVALLF